MTKEQLAHSPGPWGIAGLEGSDGEYHNLKAVQAHLPLMRVCFMTSDGPAMANARLIAAAPDMLEALMCLLPGLHLDFRYADDDDDKEALQNRIATVVDAINKARGHE